MLSEVSILWRGLQRTADYCYLVDLSIANITQSSLSLPIDLTVLVLVLIKDDLFIKRMLTQKASVYPGFFLTS